MKQYKKGDMIKFANQIHPIVDSIRITNPSEKQILADGWTVYVPVQVVIPPKLIPDDYEIEAALMLRIRKREEAAVMAEIESLSDEDALEVKALCEPWKKYINKQIKAGKRLYYDDKLYKVLQTHNVMSAFPPGHKTESLYVEINKKNKGTMDDPIPYNNNMQLVLGKFYSQNGKVYECIRDSGQPVYEDMVKLEGYGFVKSV